MGSIVEKGTYSYDSNGNLTFRNGSSRAIYVTSDSLRGLNEKPLRSEEVIIPEVKKVDVQPEFFNGTTIQSVEEPIVQPAEEVAVQPIAEEISPVVGEATMAEGTFFNQDPLQGAQIIDTESEAVASVIDQTVESIGTIEQPQSSTPSFISPVLENAVEFNAGLLNSNPEPVQMEAEEDAFTSNEDFALLAAAIKDLEDNAERILNGVISDATRVKETIHTSCAGLSRGIAKAETRAATDTKAIIAKIQEKTNGLTNGQYIPNMNPGANVAQVGR